MTDLCDDIRAALDGTTLEFVAAARDLLERALVEIERLTSERGELVGVDYCTLHNGLRNEDEHRCDQAANDLDPVWDPYREAYVPSKDVDEDGEPRECVLVPLMKAPAAVQSPDSDPPAPPNGHVEHMADPYQRPPAAAPVSDPDRSDR